FFVQRFSAIGAALFIGAHLVKARILPAIQSPTGHEHLKDMAEAMREPPTMIVYVLGTLAVAYHMANGLWGFAIHMGWYQGPAAQRRLRTFSVVFFSLMLVGFWAVIYGMATKY